MNLTDRRLSRLGVFDMAEQCASESAATRWVLDARAYWVAEEMQALACHAAGESDAVQLYPQDIPCAAGFVVYERAVAGGTPGVLSFGFAWQHIHADVLDLHEIADFGDGACIADHGQPWPLALGRSLKEQPIWRGDSGDDLWARRMPAVTLLLFGQTLVTHSNLSPNRAQRRRAIKRGRLEPADLTVIMLRRVEHHRSDADGAPVDWQHRWIVNGHWRNQWHPRQRVHRSKWIAPYVKGPDDAPLIPKRHLSVLVR